MENTISQQNNRRDCIIIANLANITGFLNNTELNRGKLRVDYGQLLTHAANGRNIIGALCVSQCDPAVMGAKSDDYRKSNRRFLYSLQAFQWTPLEVEYNSKTQDMSKVTSSVYDAVCDLVLTETGENKYDLTNVDLVFITGSNLWNIVISPFAEAGFSIEVLYPRKSTSAALYSQFIFRDLYPFVINSNQEVMNRRLQALENANHGARV